MDKIRIFVGFDERETVAYHVLVQSVIQTCSMPFCVTPLIRSQLPVNPKRDLKASTDFADTRFLVPWLCDFKGWAIFLDCDMIFRADPKLLWDLKDERYSVIVRKHNHVPDNDRKFLNQEQTRYKYKNWSSLMLFNCEKCKILKPSYINSVSGLDLHQFKWLASDKQIGSIPEGWNYLVGIEELEDKAPHLIHFTTGGPWFDEYRNCEYSRDWLKTYSNTIYAKQAHEDA